MRPQEYFGLARGIKCSCYLWQLSLKACPGVHLSSAQRDFTSEAAQESSKYSREQQRPPAHLRQTLCAENHLVVC